MPVTEAIPFSRFGVSVERFSARGRQGRELQFDRVSSAVVSSAVFVDQVSTLLRTFDLLESFLQIRG